MATHDLVQRNLCKRHLVHVAQFYLCIRTHKALRLLIKQLYATTKLGALRTTSAHDKLT